MHYNALLAPHRPVLLTGSSLVAFGKSPTSSQLAEVVFRGCQFGMLAAPPVVPSCSPHLRGPSGVEFWFYTPPGTPPGAIPTNSPGIESAPGCGPGRASAAPAGPPERAAAVLAPGPRPPPRLAAAPGLLEQHTVARPTRIKSCRSKCCTQAFRGVTEGLLDHRLALYPVLVDPHELLQCYCGSTAWWR